MTATILITRPEEAGLRFADQLRARWGCEVPLILSPMMEIVFLDPKLKMDGMKGLIFTSRHGVEALARLTPNRCLPCFAVGTATGDAARKAGFDVTDAGGDANALTACIVASQVAGPLLHIRGEHVSGDITGELGRHGIEAKELVLYRQIYRPLSKAAQACLAGGSPVILPLFSPRSARLFFEEAQPEAPLFVAAISRNVAAMVPRNKVCETVVACSPDALAMIEVLDDLRKSAKLLEGTKRAQ